MDAIDILGALLGRKVGQGSPTQVGGQPQSRQPQSRQPSASQSHRPTTIEESAQSLEDILGVAKGRQSGTPATQQPSAPAPSSPPANQRATLPQSDKAPVSQALNDQAKLLIQAMVMAAKADGQLGEDEQQVIVKQIGQVGDAEIQFLRAEFAKPVDAKELAWSIPLGMEEQAYTISLMAIELDEQTEATYLGDLAHGLRITPARCNEIHRKHNAPEIFRT